MAEKTVEQTWGRSPVSLLMVAESNHSIGSVVMPAPDLIVGLELEIENWASQAGGLNQFWRYTTDGSLRNDGRELVSHPVKTKFLENVLRTTVTHHRLGAGNYSERCSTHVHANVMDFTLSQLKVLCMLYSIVERLLFKWVGNEREESIFCVPWYQSGLTGRFVEKMRVRGPQHVAGWIKYSALNLLPVAEQGTVEFRHLHGTCDVTTILTWVKFISRLMEYGRKTDIKVLTQTVLDMNTTSNYDAFLRDVFGDDANSFITQSDFRDALSVGVVDTKMMLLKPQKKQEYKPMTGEEMEALIARDHAIREERVRTAPIPRVRPATPNPMRARVVDVEDAPTAAAPPMMLAGYWDQPLGFGQNAPNPIAEQLNQARARVQLDRDALAQLGRDIEALNNEDREF